MRCSTLSRHPKKLRSKKSGLPPGSLVHIGEIKTPEPQLRIIEYGPDGILEHHFNEARQLLDWQQTKPQVWLNLYGLQDAALLNAIGQHFGLHPLVLEDIANTDQRPKVDFHQGYCYLVLHHYALGPTREEVVFEQISLITGRNFVLSLQERPTGTLGPVRERLLKNAGTLRSEGSDMLTYSLLDAVVDAYFGVVEQLSEKSESLELAITGSPGPVALQSIQHMKQQISRLRRNLWPLRELMGTLIRGGDALFSSGTEVYLRDVQDHTIHLLESLEDLRDLVTGLQDVYFSTISHRVNLEVRLLAVVATIFMPATLIAGIFGMNFHFMPWLENPEGFSWALGMMTAIAISMLLIFARRRFL